MASTPKTIVSKGRAVWEGDLQSGSGQTSLATSGLGTFDVTWKARAEEHGGLTSPEELLAAAHAACYPMQLSLELTEAGATVERLEVEAEASFRAGAGITGIHLTVNGTVKDVSAEEFERVAQSAKVNCPVSMALTGTEITLTANLV